MTHRLSLALALIALGCAPPEQDFGAQFAEVVVCADGPTVKGIDVSRWQGDIDWDQVAASGVKFAFIRAGHGLEPRDIKFDYNWAEAKRVGIIRGAYHFLEPDLDIAAQAQIMIDAMATLEPGDLPPVLDIEDTGGLSAAQIVTRSQQWIDMVEAATGRQVIIYTGKYFWQDNVGSSDAMLEHPLWVPQYGPECPDLPSPWTEWVFFQTTNMGEVPGITENVVDLDLFNGDMAALRAFANGMPECGDGTCNGDENHATCPGDCPVCEPVPAEGRIVDEAEVCFEAEGDPTYWRHEAAGYGGSLLWTHTVDGDTTYNYAVWNLEMAQAGLYRIEVHTPSPFGESMLASYRVMHAGVEERFPLDQTAVAGWSPLADVELAAGGEQWVRVDDNTGEPGSTETKLVVDAIRLTRLDAIEPPGDAGSAPGSDGGVPMPSGDGGASTGDGGMVAAGGCAAAHGRPAPVWIAGLLAVLGLATRRRAR